MKKNNLKLYTANCCGEIGDVIIDGYDSPPGKTILEQSIFIHNDNKLRNFVLNEPRGGVFKHINLLVQPVDKSADIGFIIMEPEDTPPMSGSNSICVTTVLLEKGIIPIKDKKTTLTLEAPGGLIKAIAYCEKNKVKSVKIFNIDSFVHKLDHPLEVKGLGTLKVDVAFGGDTFVLIKGEDLGISIKPENAKDIVNISSKIINASNEQIIFHHPLLPHLKHISFCEITEPIYINNQNQKEAKNTVCIRPGKLDRSPCGTGTCARLAVMHSRGEIKKGEKFISKSIIDSTFISMIEDISKISNINSIKTSIEGSAFITGKQELYVDDRDPFPEGYRLSDTWPKLDKNG